ncbi:MAG: hypothetical protein GY807_17530 [Gammaproteobacteria bacterium]|nr:hypothetical protein [Gammaproteobacteria bacterium]
MFADTISFKKTLYIDAPAAIVFDFWSDFRNFPKFVWLIERVDIIDDTKSRWIIKAPLGKKVEFKSEIKELVPSESIIWESRHYAVDSGGNIKFTESGRGTRVQLLFSYSIKAHWVHRLAKVMNRLGFPSASFDDGLRKIKRQIERDQSKTQKNSPRSIRANNHNG